jgi:aspartate 1-decarboxylase
MLRRMLKSKIHGALVTDADVSYEGSVTIDRELMDAAEFTAFEEVHIWDLTSGERITTYVIEGDRGSGTIAINGAAAHLIRRGDRVIIASFATYDGDELARHAVRKVFVDDDNAILRTELCRGDGRAPGAHAIATGEGRSLD